MSQTKVRLIRKADYILKKAFIKQKQNDFNEAKRLYHETIDIYDQLSMNLSIARVLIYNGILQEQNNDFEYLA